MMQRGISIIFHGIGTPDRILEPGEAPYWITVDRFEQVLNRIVALPDPTNVHITFDDGNVSDHAVALRGLRDRGLKADIFVLTGRIGAKGSLSREQITDLQNAGFRIGSHGVGHRNWARLDPAALAYELVNSRQVLQALCGPTSLCAAIPFGSYNARVITALKSAGYTCAWTSDHGRHDPNAFLRPRTSIKADTTDTELTDILAGRLSPMAWARRTIGMTKKRF